MSNPKNFGLRLSLRLGRSFFGHERRPMFEIKFLLLLFLKSLLGFEPNIYNFIHYIESECQLNAFEYKLTVIILIQFEI